MDYRKGKGLKIATEGEGGGLSTVRYNLVYASAVLISLFVSGTVS